MSAVKKKLPARAAISYIMWEMREFPLKRRQEGWPSAVAAGLATGISKGG